MIRIALSAPIATATFSDGRVFRGTFVNDQQQGPGELTFKDGRKITGQFLDHVPNGQAVEMSNQGTLNGVWTKGTLSGMVTVTYADDSTVDGRKGVERTGIAGD